MRLPILTDLKELKNKRVLVRVDFNVPLAQSAVHFSKLIVADDSRIRAAIPTIEFLRKQGSRVILMTHFGRPEKIKNKKSKIKNKEELKIIAERAGELLKKKVLLAMAWNFEEIAKQIKKMRAGQVLILPNLRLQAGEEENSVEFAKDLAGLGDIYVNEAFSVSHRQHASLVGVPKLLPRAAGLHLEKELLMLSKIFNAPRKPFIAMIGGAKVMDKLSVVKTLSKKAKAVLVGSVLASHLLKATGFEVGQSTIDPKALELAKGLLKNKKIIMPCDVVVGTLSVPKTPLSGVGKFNGERARVVDVKNKKSKIKNQKLLICEQDEAILDIGPKTILEFSRYIKIAKTLLWVGPMGYYEIKEFSYGTIALACLFAACSKGKAFGVVGGGETMDALSKTGLAQNIDWISTGGGALLKYLSGGKLPGVEALIR